MNNNKTIIELTSKHYTININTIIIRSIEIPRLVNTHTANIMISNCLDFQCKMAKERAQLENSFVGQGRFSNIKSHLLKYNYRIAT